MTLAQHLNTIGSMSTRLRETSTVIVQAILSASLSADLIRTKVHKLAPGQREVATNAALARWRT